MSMKPGQRIDIVGFFFLFMHSDTENNVKATRTEGVNFKEQPGVFGEQ